LPSTARTHHWPRLIFAKHCKDAPLAKAGLDRDDVYRLTKHMRREAWLPTKWGVDAMTEFLDAGFKDMTKNDYRKWGVTNHQAQGWARRNSDRITKSKTTNVEDGKTDSTTTYNWK
jgi:hypothetical protein